MTNPLPSDIFARRLRLERERQKLSQAELARRIADLLGTNIDPTAVTRIEQQTRAVRLDEAVAMATVLSVPLSALIVESDLDELEVLSRRYLIELVTAQHAWEKARQEVERITKLIQAVSGTNRLYHPGPGSNPTGSTGSQA